MVKFKSDYNNILIGDMNARTGLLSDIVINDDSQFVSLPNDFLNDVELALRQNCDKKDNQFGKMLLVMCKMTGLRIVNGQKFGDSSGKKTSHFWNSSSTVDYLVTDVETFPQIQTFRVLDYLSHNSDHCPISAVFNLDIPRYQMDNETMIIRKGSN